MSEQSSPTASRIGSPDQSVFDAETPRPKFRFNWDTSRTPAPESVSGTTDRGDYAQQQPQIPHFGASTSTLALPEEWSSSRHGFHAISTVLNNPHKRQAPPKAHSSLPPVPPADLPRVRRKDFDSYLDTVSPEWTRFQRSTELGREGSAKLDTPRPSINSDSPFTVQPPQRQTSGVGKLLPPLETVPSVFFEPTFNLGDPDTFGTITEQQDPTALSHSLPLLEKFSHYADTVEQHLVREISVRSTSFFAALSNLHELQSESEECLDRITKLRSLLRDVDEKSAKRGLQVVCRDGRIRHLDTVREGVQVVAGVIEMTGVAKDMVTAGQWGEALGVIDEMEGLWDGKSGEEQLETTPTQTHSRHNPPKGRMSPLPPTPEEQGSPVAPLTNGKTPSRQPIVPLSSLNAFASLPAHLRTLTMEITSSLTSELVNVLRVDLVERIQRPQSSPGSSSPGVNQSLKDRLRPLLHGLVRTKGVREATLSWREVVMGEFRDVIKQHVPSLEVEEGVNLGKHLREMEHVDFLDLIQVIYLSLLSGVEGLQEQSSVIVDVIRSIQLSDPPDIPALQEELSDILSSAAELANTQAAKVVSRRAEQHAALELEEFLLFFNDSWTFVVKCEVICRRMIVGLRGIVVGQAKSFLQAYHQARLNRSAKLVEDEQWNPAEISPFLQHVAQILVDSAVQDVPELVLITDPTASTGLLSPPSSAVPPPSALHSPFAPAPRTNGSSTLKAGGKYLHIEDRTYYAVSATVEVLVLLVDYLRVIINLSMLTTDTMSRVIEFLKAFNSRTCQVVLGAGAMRSAGLKNITAKHLALASQSLSIMIALIPYVRETFRRHLSSKQAVMLVEFDKLKRDYQEHQNEIHTKLIAIMGDRLTVHIKTLQAVNWDVPKPGGGVNDYMEVLVKETVTLHKVLSRYLSTPVLEYVMTQVFAAINHGLSEAYGTIELPHQEAKARLLADAKFLHDKLTTLKNVGTPSGMLETVVRDKSIPRLPGAPTSPPPVKNMASNANQRLRGLLSATSAFNKALPSPVVASAATPRSPQPHVANGGGLNKPNGQTQLGNPLPPTPTPADDPPAYSSGFMQVQSPAPGDHFSSARDPIQEGSPAPAPPLSRAKAPHDQIPPKVDQELPPSNPPATVPAEEGFSPGVHSDP